MYSGNGFNLLIAGVNVLHDLVAGECIEVCMCIGMVHDLMTRLGERLNRLGIAINPIPHHKKGCLDIILAQNVDELLRILIPPG